MNAAIYARVSTTGQKDNGYSLGSQVRECQTYAERNGLNVVAAIQDDISGATPAVMSDEAHGRRRPRPDIRCAHCGRRMSAGNGRRQYCTTACRVAAHRRRQGVM